LTLKRCPGLARVSIHSRSLRRLFLAYDLIHRNDPETMVLTVDAPNLESLRLNEAMSEWYIVKILDTSKLKLLGLLSADAEMLQLGESLFQVPFFMIAVASFSICHLWVAVDVPSPF